VRKTPQIPEDFFEDPAPAAPAATATALQTASTQTVKTSKRSARETSRPLDGVPSSGPKRQVTIYLSDRALAALERTRLELLVDHGLRVPKSAIAEHAILAAAGDPQGLADALRQVEG